MRKADHLQRFKAFMGNPEVYGLFRLTVTELADLLDALQRRVEPSQVIGALVFQNNNSIRSSSSVLTNAYGANQIMPWYGAFHPGDEYAVFFKGRTVPIDGNGAPITPL